MAHILLIHGINDNALWHKQVSRLLEPHFKCHSIRYREYHWCPLGIPIILWWAVLLLGPALAAAALTAFHPALAEDADDFCLLLLFLGSVVVFAHEYAWEGATGFLLLPILLLLTGLVFAALGFAGWIGPGLRQLALLLALAGQVVVIEARVYHFGDPNYTIGWHFFPNLLWPYPLPAYALALWLLARYSSGILWWGPSVVWGVGLLTLLIWAWKEAERRRLRTLDKVFAQLAVRCRGGGTTHLIAHSLGSYLTGLILEDQLGKGRTLQLDSLILVGCVLRRDYNWGRQLQNPGAAVQAVWNVQGRMDDVAHTAGSILGKWVPRRRFGSAGKDGFAGPPTEVHDVHDPFAACPSCLWTGPGRIHNIILDTGTHASTFLSQIDPTDLWLPFLWEMAPGEFRVFRKLCLEGQEALDAVLLDRFDKKEAEFRGRLWNWTRWPRGGESVLDWVTKTLPPIKNALDALLTPTQRRAGPTDVEPFLFRHLCFLQTAIEELLSSDGAAPSSLVARLFETTRGVLPALEGRPTNRDVLLHCLHPGRSLTLGLGMALIYLK